MCIPAGFTRNEFSFHGLVSRNHIFDRTGLHMSDVRLAVCSWRAIIKGVGLSFLAVFHALLKDVIVIPELLDLFFSVYEIQIRINFLIHC